MSEDWTELYNTTPVLMETFVETTRHTGAVYTASRWIRVGTTQGRGRYDRDKAYDKPRKDIWLRPLRREEIALVPGSAVHHGTRTCGRSWHLLESDLLQGLELDRQASNETRVDPAGTDEEPLKGRPASHHRIGPRALPAGRGAPSDSPHRAQDQKTVFKTFAVPDTKSSISSRVGSLSLAWSQMFQMSARS